MRRFERQISIVQQASSWLVRIVDPGSTQTYCCPTEQMALQFAAVFERAAQTVARAA